MWVEGGQCGPNVVDPQKTEKSWLRTSQPGGRGAGLPPGHAWAGGVEVMGEGEPCLSSDRMEQQWPEERLREDRAEDHAMRKRTPRSPRSGLMADLRMWVKRDQHASTEWRGGREGIHRGAWEQGRPGPGGEAGLGLRDQDRPPKMVPVARVPTKDRARETRTRGSPRKDFQAHPRSVKRHAEQPTQVWW